MTVGLGPTPMLYYAVHELGCDGGIMVTGSHNPPAYNGFKLLLASGPFYGADIQALGAMAAAGDWAEGTAGSEAVDLTDRYVDRLLRGLDLPPLTIAWDAGNGAAGPVVERLVARLPGTHHTLFTDVDPAFPNHHPDPTEEKNLADLKRVVAERGCDLGVAFDGDGDRIGAVDGQGRVVWGDQILSILAAPVLAAVPGATIIADVKASAMLFDRVAELGGVPLMWKTGHSLIKAKMKETGAPLAGEMSGHIFFAHDWYGFDDGLYAAVRLIARDRRRRHLARGAEGRDAGAGQHARAALPDRRKRASSPSSPRCSAACAQAAREVDETDGARVTTADGWWLLRASNTQDVLVARAEARDEAALERLMAELNAALAASGVAPVASH